MGICRLPRLIGFAALYVMCLGAVALAQTSGKSAAVPALAGDWVCSGQCSSATKAHIAQDGLVLHFTNENGGKSEGRVASDSQSVVANDWNDLRGNLEQNGTVIRWTNGTVWTKVSAVQNSGKHAVVPGLAGEWVCRDYCPQGGEGKTAHIAQSGVILHFINEGGGKSEGRVASDSQSVLASDCGNLQGNLERNATLIRWTNGTVWAKVPATSTLSNALRSQGKVDIYTILFDVDESEIKPQSQSTINAIVGLMKSDPSLKLEVSGHTDNTGSAAHNQQLSQARAKAVVADLVKNGVSAARLQAKGYGDTRPVASNSTDAGRAQNRRVQLRKL